MSFRSVTLGLALALLALLGTVAFVAGGFSGGDAIVVALAPR